MKNRSTMISMFLATGSIAAFAVILGNLESPSSSLSQSTPQSVMSPKGQSEEVNPGFSYEYDFDDDDKNGKEVNERSDRGHGKGKRYGKNNKLLPSAGTASASNSGSTSNSWSASTDNSTSNSAPNTSSDSSSIQPEPRQSTTQAS